MPPHTEEDMHFHHKSKQFFYILSREAKMKFKDETVKLKEGTGVEVPPMEVHQMRNTSDKEIEFIEKFCKQKTSEVLRNVVFPQKQDCK